MTIRTERLTVEIEPGVTFENMTFEGQVPGPMIRVREGDRVNLTFEVPEDLNMVAHNMDYRCVHRRRPAEVVMVGYDVPAMEVL